MTSAEKGLSGKAQRYAAIAASAGTIGIDFVDLEPVSGGWRIDLHFIPPLQSVEAKMSVLESIDVEHVQFSIDGDTSPNARITSVRVDPSNPWVLEVHVGVEDPNDIRFVSDLAPVARVRIVDVPAVDALFDSIDVLLGARTARLDPARAAAVVPSDLVTPVIDYLSKDYLSFRGLMFDVMTQSVPNWREQHAADVGVTILEVLAYAGDRLSYYQDAVGTESALETARKRTSVRRHARLLDYHVAEGCNSRVWIHVEISTANGAFLQLPKGTAFLTRVPGFDVRIDPLELPVALQTNARVFESVEVSILRETHNRLPIYAWGLDPYVLPAGTTSASIAGHVSTLEVGDVLVLSSSRRDEASLTERFRHAVRIVEIPRQTQDPLYGRDITEIVWHDDDALPSDLVVTGGHHDGSGTSSCEFLGNILLADSGSRVHGERLPHVPSIGPYRPRLAVSGLVFRVPRHPRAARASSATQELEQDPSKAVPDVRLHERYRLPGKALDTDVPSVRWRVAPDLLSSGPRSRDFVVETEDDRSATLRFGDNEAGLAPSSESRFTVDYRVGGGSSDNVGPDTICHIVTTDGEYIGVGNPIGARGGVDPESTDVARRLAPDSLGASHHAITARDFATIALRHDDVRSARAELRWTGSWPTAFVYVERASVRQVDRAFLQDVDRFLEPYRIAGTDIAVIGPEWLPLDVAMSIHAARGYSRARLRRDLGEVLGAGAAADGRRGFFAPGNFGFGQCVFLSQIVAAAASVDGVERVVVERFHPLGRPLEGELERGRIDVGRFEIVRADSDPARPQYGGVAVEIIEGAHD